MLLDKAELVGLGIDWFTTTAVDENTATILLIKADNLLWKERKTGGLVKPWKMAGYSGFRCGRLEFGIRSDGAVVRVSSDLAAETWWDLYQITGRCSRIDLQATFRVGSTVDKRIRRVGQSVRRYYKSRTDGPTVTEWSNNLGGRTVYLGSRQSDLYFRCYNKGSQSGQPEFQGCMRAELEVKGKLCHSVIDWLLGSEYVGQGIASTLSKFAIERGISTNLESGNLPLYFVESRTVTDSLKVLRWLEVQIKPSVQRMIAAGYESEVIESLGLSNFARVNRAPFGPSGPSDNETEDT